MAYSDIQSRALAQIAYIDLGEEFDTYCQAKGTNSAPLSEVLSEDDYNEIKNYGGFTDEEMESLWISGVHDTNANNGFYACIIETNHEGAANGAESEAVVCFRGSEDMGELDNVVNDWVKADIGLVNSTCTNQQEEVERFLQEYSGQLENYDHLAMVGHSLGGNLAEYATIVSDEYGLDDKIDQCVSMDGPGFSQEFIKEHKQQIERMSEVIYHPRWSFVGTMLMDLPGVKYQYVQVSNDANAIDDEEYNRFTRHLTKYLLFDENGNHLQGEQDSLSCVTALMSKGIERLPTAIGNALTTLVGGVWISAVWAKEEFFNEDESISVTGWKIIAVIGGMIAVFGVQAVVISVIIAVLAVILVSLVAIATELIYELVMAVADALCKVVADIRDWTMEAHYQLKEMVHSLVNNAKNWMKSNFNNGYKYAIANPQISLDTYRLRNYAQRLLVVNNRISNLDGRMDSLYWSVGLRDLWNLMQADLLTGYSWRLLRAASYLNETATDFDVVETELVNSL